jgi:hypothetical protein
MRVNVVQLLATPSEQKDVGWLRRGLQLALEVELSTLPPYLCGLWSVKDNNQPVRRLIRTIVLQEMLHMGLACNMLTAVGGTPQIVDGFRALVYPGPLPGDVHPELTVYLSGLSKLYIQQVYLVIEYPEGGPLKFAVQPTYPTIGKFYDTILETFQRLNPELSQANQLTYPGLGSEDGLFVIKSMSDVERAITEIKHQGEGTPQSPLDPGSMGTELAHYYKFAEILFERTLVQTDGKWDFTGDPLPFPPTYPMAPIPQGGYMNPSEIARAALLTFNQRFTEMLGSLQTAWSLGNQEVLNTGVGQMFALGTAATKIMQIHLPDSNGVYGPDFRLTTLNP